MDKNSVWYIWASDTAPSIKRRVAKGEHILPNDVARLLENETDLIACDNFREAVVVALNGDQTSRRRVPMATLRLREVCLQRLLEEPYLVVDPEIRSLILDGLKGELKPKRGRSRLSDAQLLFDMVYFTDTVAERKAQIKAERKARSGPRDRTELSPCIQAAKEVGVSRMLSGPSLLNAISRYRKERDIP